MESGYLPEIAVVKPRPIWQWLVIRFGPVVAIMIVGFAILAARTHNSALVTGGLWALGALAVLVAVEMPLILRVQARRQEQCLNAAPPGALYAVQASQVGFLGHAVSGPAAARRGSCRGRLLLDRTGVSFTAPDDRGLPCDMAFTWQQLSKVTVTRGLGTDGARLTVTTAAGQTVSWLGPGLPRLVEVLDQLQSERRDRSGS